MDEREARAALQTQLDEVERLLGHSRLAVDGWAGFELLSELTVLSDAVQDAIALAVRFERDSGGSWSQIGSALGVSKQAAQQRFGGQS